MRALPGAIRAAYSLAWLRLLDHRDLDDLTMLSYANSSGSGFASEAHNIAGLHAWEEATFREMLLGCLQVLVAGAGGGREMITLARMGHKVTGFDASDDLAEACRANLTTAGVTATMINAGPGAVPDGQGRFDALVIGRGVYHHIPGRAKRIAFLRACATLLIDRAPLIMGDVLTRQEHKRTQLLTRLIAREPGDSVSDSFYHFFTVQELAEEIAEAGFADVDCRVTPVPGRRRLAHVVARKLVQ
ncbi:class I SAM-dependent methyltransferase [Sphingomonas sp.]|uniref:class I SAM-dependent methyltransferase n=1 Tax=Sphingomonas sp. TaxID=28214 RepID=UPI00286A2309|nr:class I SAM-dependent methyltransferase [Sphingomonas sp.]